MFTLRNILRSASKNLFYLPKLPQRSTLPLFHHKNSFFFATTQTQNTTNASTYQGHLEQGIASSKQFNLDASIKSYNQVIENLAPGKGSTLPEDDLSVLLKTYQELGHIYKIREDFPEAFKQYFHAIKLAEKSGLADTVEVADLYNLAGEMVIYFSEPREAKTHLDKAREIYNKLGQAGNKGINNRLIDNTHKTALMYIHKNMLDDALALLEKTLEKVQKAPSDYEGEFELGNIYQSIGNIYNKKDNLNKAMEYWKKGVEHAIKRYGEDSIQLLPFYEFMIVGLYEHGQLDGAAHYEENSLQILEKLDNKVSPDKAKHYLLLGNIDFERGQFKRALDSFMKALGIYQKYSTRYPEEIALVYHKMAQIYDYQKDSSQALAYYNQGLEFALKYLGENHMKVADYYLFYGDIKYKESKPAEAKEFFQKALNLYLKDPEYVDKNTFVDIYFDLGVIYYLDKAFTESIEYFLKSLKYAWTSGQPRVKLIEDTYNFVGLGYLGEKKSEEAIAYFQKALDECLKTTEQQHMDVYYRNLALGNEAGGKFAEAIDHFKKALELAEKNFGKESKLTMEYVDILIDRLPRLERVAEAEEIGKKYKPQKKPQENKDATNEKPKN